MQTNWTANLDSSRKQNGNAVAVVTLTNSVTGETITTEFRGDTLTREAVARQVYAKIVSLEARDNALATLTAGPIEPLAPEAPI